MIDTLLSSALNDSKISHEEFTNVITEKNIYENIKRKYKRYSRVKFFRTYDRRKINGRADNRVECFST